MADIAEEKGAEARENGAVGKKGWRRLLGWLLGIAIFLCVIIFGVPLILPLISFPEIVVDLSEAMKDAPPELFPDQTLKVKYGIEKRRGGWFVATAKGRVLGWPFTATASVRPKLRFWGVDAIGDAEIVLDGSAIGATVDFSASLPGGWQADVEMQEKTLTNEDPFIESILRRHPEKDVRRMVFSALASLTAHAKQTPEIPVPQWEAKVRIGDANISMNADGTPIKITNLRMTAGASGIAEHIDIMPMFPHVDSIEAAGCVLSNAFASVRATERSFLVTEAGAGFCGGDILLYAFFLDMEKMNAGVTIYMDGIDAGQALGHINGFRGTATGRLNGKLPIKLSDGKELHFDSGYLHSVPGETGKLQIYDPKPITDNLTLGGVSQEASDNLADALADLDYSALKIGLTPEGKDSMALTMKLEGVAVRGDVSVPVSFVVTFHGQLEQLINTGLMAASRKNSDDRQ